MGVYVPVGRVFPEQFSPKYVPCSTREHRRVPVLALTEQRSTDMVIKLSTLD